MNYKILFILHYPPPVHGSSVVGQFIKNSERINKAFYTRYINLTTSFRVNEIGKNSPQKLLRYFLILIKVLNTLFFFKPDLIYIAITAKGGAFYKDALIALLAKTLGFKVVYHMHNKGVSQRQDKVIDNFLYKKGFKNSSVILLSKFLYPDIQKYVPKEKVFYCPNGIPDIAKRKSKFNDDKPVQILFLSNLIESKGIYILLKALSLLKTNDTNFKYVIVGGEGDISGEELKMKISNLNLNDRVVYAGKKYNQDKSDVYENSDIFVFPTYNECFPLVLLEAMQHSLPVISTFEGGIPDIVKDGVSGFLVKQKDIQGLAGKLELLIKNPQLRKKMGEEGRKIYEQKFTLEVFENKLKNILQNIISQ